MKTKILLLILLVFLFLAAAPAQVSEDRGAMGLAQALNRLDVVASVLHTGAHPDDENSALLAWLSRGQGVRTAYLSATRGDGGQNLLGIELFESLGVIRTEELLAARRFDRAQQFFTPVYEFGFSKTAEESFEKWGREAVLGDFVRVIRHFRPEIVISRFTGTTQDGHGHHQVAGIATQEAFRAAADPSRFPEYGPAWQVKKLYLNTGTQQTGIEIAVGDFDAPLGRSYHQIAMEGRSLHRSQGMGAAQDAGPRTTRLQLVDKAVDVFDNADLFQGVIYKLSDLAQLDGSISAEVNQLQQRVNDIRERANLAQPAALAPGIAAALNLLRQTRAKTTHDHVRFLLDIKEADFEEAFRLAAGLTLDVLVSDDSVVPGQELNLTLSVVNGGPYEFSTVRTTTDLPPGWDAAFDRSTGSAMPGQRLEQRFQVQVAADAEFTQPYWLRGPRTDDRFEWPAGAAAMMPFDPPLLRSYAEVDFEGVPVSLSGPAQFRLVDDRYGELRSLLNVVPALSVRMDPEVAIVPLRGSRQKEFTVTIENQNPATAGNPTESEVQLVVPQGWSVTPASAAVRFTRQGEKASVRFTVTVPPAAGEFTVAAVARHGGREYRSGYTAIAYPHIETRYLYSAAQSRVEVFDVESRVTSLGYVEGVGDRVPEALRQLGITVTMLSAEDLASGDLSRFPVIVLGIRAYAVRDDLIAYNSRLLDYVSRGGTLIVQYNTYEILNGQFGPYPFTINRPHDRVTVEEAPVRMLDSAHPVLSAPNRISDADFDGWVQERGLYFLGSWDPRYVSLLESNDPGEESKGGGMVVARYGEGTYVYTGYAFFRQLPAGVQGAYRLFANLVSLGN